ncbi:MAG: type IV secretory system conjugative DNA transfer family protein [Pseudomonadota bacterium]|uniref:type IV secretory system conjugative DNA transfer family protein n=1 Tax=Burkholderiaceae TaxID=119060 RepID=UPI0010F60351|nr:type IV secretory system conjugative DNA transfer family protein [Burkholderia sp. 4M9327F10]
MKFEPATILLACAAAWATVACPLALADATDTSDMSVNDIANLSVDTVPAAAAITPIRANELQEAALPLGSHKGLADRSAKLLAELEARGTRLDTMYRFGALVTRNGMLPPVITEARDAVEATSDQIRTADSMYRIVVPSRFITVAPSWRDYLFVGLRIKAQTDQVPFSAVLPKTAAEREYWKEQVMLGYAQGEALADQILQTNFNRLNRDYTGMLRYSELLNKGMVSEPSIAVAPQVVSGDRSHINVGDTLYRVTDHGGFVTDPNRWQASVAPADASPSTPPALQPQPPSQGGSP